MLAVLRRRLRVTDGASVSAAGMALTEGRSVKDGCEEFKDKFVEYTMASTPVLSAAPSEPTSLLCKQLVLVLFFMTVT